MKEGLSEINKNIKSLNEELGKKLDDIGNNNKIWREELRSERTKGCLLYTSTETAKNLKTKSVN